MTPSGNQVVAPEELREKFANILANNGIFEEVYEVLISEPPELIGEHMATSTVYALIKFKDETIKPKNLFMKRYSGNALHRELVKKMKIMEKESSFFNDFLPFTQEFCKNYTGCENLLNFFPKCFYGDDEMVILENLVLDDTFIMLPKEDFQDMHTAKKVLSNLAKFHAATYALINKTGKEEFKQKWELNIKEAFDSTDNPMMEQMFDNGINTCMNILNGPKMEGTEYGVEKLASFIGKVSPIIQDLLKVKPEENFLVLNHGDCWNNNMLFKRDPETGKVNDHILVDLQITRLGSPNLDIGYFLFTSVKPEVRRNNLHDLLKYYYAALEDNLELFGLKCPISYEEFFLDYKKHCILGYFINLSFMSTMGAFKDVDMENLGTNPEEMTNIFNQAISNWIDRNLDKAKNIATEIIASTREYEALQAN